jgi:hypothetical protein
MAFAELLEPFPNQLSARLVRETVLIHIYGNIYPIVPSTLRFARIAGRWGMEHDKTTHGPS